MTHEFVASGHVELLGVHPIVSEQPAHLVHLIMTHEFDEVDWCLFTQVNPELDRSSWQVAYDEHLLERLPDGRSRVVFFFHYLDFARPFLTPAGPLPRPAATPLPADLAHIEYEEPS